MLSENVRAARRFARERHAGQKRKHGPDYIFHPEEVAALLAFRYDVEDETTLCAAFLHDVIEECGVAADELADRFGATVAGMVAALSRDKSRPYKEYAQRLATEGTSVILIKGSDMVSNLRDCLLADRRTRCNVTRHARRYVVPLVEATLGADHLLARDLRVILEAVENR